MKKLYYIGLDVHKKIIQYCIKLIDGEIVREGRIAATRAALADWASSLDRPWKGALEIGDPHRFGSAGRAMSYRGLVAAQQESAGKQHRQPLSKKRNAHLQRVPIEAAHLAPRYHPRLHQLYERVRHREHTGAAVVAVARKPVSYLLAVDRSRRPFQLQEEEFAPSSPAGSVCGPPAPPIEGAGLAHRSSPSRVRTAALAQAPAPWTAAGRRASSRPAMGGSGGKQTPPVD